MKKKFLIFFIAVFLVVGSLLISTNSTDNLLKSDAQRINKGQLTVYTSIYPLYDLASKIAGDKLEVNLVVPNGAELHSYRPSPRKIAQLERADLFFYIGLGVESWAPKAVQNLTNVGVKTIKISQIVNLRTFGEQHKAHEHKEKEGSYDPHIWLDPINMKKIAKKIKNQFVSLDSKNKKVYQANYQQVIHKIEELNQEYKSTLKGVKQNYILVSHAAFGYLADRYGFKQLSVTGVAPHQEPSLSTLAKLTDKAKEYNLEYIFMETLANPKTVNVLAQEAGLKVLPLNPIAGLTQEEKVAGADYFSLMKENLNNLKKALVSQNERNNRDK
ncbi:metal ABC transporter solute-binding protein, Zn/Mn family [Halobacteroides halobius]|nr:zinc ABC transporter substrate-binding protein [Halobacteroides halobius]